MDPVSFGAALLLAATAIGLVALAYINQDKPDWQRDMPKIMAGLAVDEGEDPSNRCEQGLPDGDGH